MTEEMNDISIEICQSLAKSRGSSPVQLAEITGLSPKEIVDKIKELDYYGLIRKDNNEIEEVGEEWAFYALTYDGYKLCNAPILNKNRL